MSDDKKKRSHFDKREVRLEPGMSAGRVPPHDLDAEAAALSAALLDREALLILIGLLLPEHFYSDANGRIFEAVIDLHKIGKPVDIVSVAGWLRDRERLGQIGGASYLGQLADATPAVAHIAGHAAVVYEKWRLRRTIAVCQKVAAEGYGDVGIVQEYIDGAHMSIGALANAGYQDRRGVTAREGIVSIFSAWQNPGPDTRLSLGIPELDRLLRRVRGKQMVVIGAHSGIGKSALVTCFVSNFARTTLADGKKIGGVVFAAEMGKEEYLERMIFALARVDSYKIDEDYRHLITPEEWQQISLAAQALAVDHLRIIDDCDDMTESLAELRKVKREFEEMGVELRYAVWDYAQIFTPGAAAVKIIGNREQEVSAVGRLCKKACKELDIVGFMLAQLNEDSRKEGRKPSARDMRESKGLLQDADKAVLIYNPHQEARANAYYSGGEAERDTDGEEVDLIVGKNRGGRPGTVKAIYYPAFTLFMPWSDAPNVRRMPSEVPKARGRK